SKVGTGEVLASPTIACAARWKTASMDRSRRRDATRPASRRSPLTSSTSSSTPTSSSPLGSAPPRSREVTSAPEARRARASQAPAKPCPPVTSALIWSGRSSRRLLAPDGPRRLPGVPGVVEQHGVLVGVHAVPESFGAKGAELAVGGETLERLPLEHAVLGEIRKHARLEAEEAAVDPALHPRLLVEAADQPVVTELGDPELQPGPDHRHRRERSARPMELRQGVEVDVGHAVRVGRGERLPPHPLLR